MKKFAIGLSLAALAIAGTAMAEQAWGPGGRDASVTRAEALARAAQVFDKLDVNHDGKIDSADRDAMRAAMFDRIDTNKDGQISRSEFLAMRPGRGGHDMGGHDIGGHDMGGPGGHEHRMHGHGMEGYGMGGMMLMRMADSNHDGAVSKDEFMAAAATRFDTADANHDGTLTSAERQAAHQSMREHMHAMMHHGRADDAAMPPAPPQR